MPGESVGSGLGAWSWPSFGRVFRGHNLFWLFPLLVPGRPASEVLSRRAEELLSALDQTTNLSRVQLGPWVVVGVLPEVERVEQEPVEATIQNLCLREAGTVLAYDLRVPGEPQALREQEPFRDVEVAIVRSRGGEVRAAGLQHQPGDVEGAPGFLEKRLDLLLQRILTPSSRAFQRKGRSDVS